MRKLWMCDLQNYTESPNLSNVLAVMQLCQQSPVIRRLVTKASSKFVPLPHGCIMAALEIWIELNPVHMKVGLFSKGYHITANLYNAEDIKASPTKVTRCWKAGSKNKKNTLQTKVNQPSCLMQAYEVIIYFSSFSLLYLVMWNGHKYSTSRPQVTLGSVCSWCSEKQLIFFYPRVSVFSSGQTEQGTWLGTAVHVVLSMQRESCISTFLVDYLSWF